MDPVVDQAICLRQWDYSETSQTAALFCRELGIVRVLGKGSKRNDPRFSGGLEVATLGEAVVIPKESGLAVLAGWDLRHTYRRVRSSMASYAAAMLAVELPRMLLSEDEPHAAAFDGLVRFLERVGSETWSVELAVWLWRLLTESGYRPALDAPPPHAGFSPDLGRLVSSGERSGARLIWRVHPTTVRGLVRLAAAETPEAGDAVRVGRLLAWYARELAGREPASMASVFGPAVPTVAQEGGSG
ncbi:MAG: recombination protein O N-terminal domain-containing protein [Planctomycetota bacterium]